MPKRGSYYERRPAYNFNLMKTQFNKHGLRVPSVVFYNGLEYGFNEISELNHGLMKYRKGHTFITVRYNLDEGEIVIRTLLHKDVDDLVSRVTKWPKYYSLQSIVGRRCGWIVGNDYSRCKYEETVLKCDDPADLVISKVDNAFKQLINNWTPILNVYRNPAFKEYLNQLKARREALKAIRTEYSNLLSKLSTKLANCAAIENDEYNIA